MEGKISLQLTKPDKIVYSGECAAVILPAAAGNLTVVAGRAPGLVLLTDGMLQLLNEKNQVTAKYFLHGGVAENAGDVCKVAAELVVNKQSASLEEAIAAQATAAESEKAFYQVIIDELTAFPTEGEK